MKVGGALAESRGFQKPLYLGVIVIVESARNPAKPQIAADPNATRTSRIVLPVIANPMKLNMLTTTVRPSTATM